MKKYRRESWLQRSGPFFGFLAAMAVLGFLAQLQWVGALAILVYIIVALVRHTSSNVTYLLAYAALTMVPIGVVTANWVAAQNFGAYAFLLFVGGVIHTTVELKRQYRAKK